MTNAMMTTASDEEQKRMEHDIAIWIFKKEQHLDPDDMADFDAEDFGFSRMEERYQRHYLIIANDLFCRLCNAGWTPSS